MRRASRPERSYIAEEGCQRTFIEKNFFNQQQSYKTRCLRDIDFVGKCREEEKA